MQEITTLLKKYNNFKCEQLRHIEKTSDTSYIVTLVIQDDEGEDVNTIKLNFTDVQAYKILVNSALAYMDMGDGITLIKENDLYGFAIGRGTAMLHVNSAPLFIVASNIEITEA